MATHAINIVKEYRKKMDIPKRYLLNTIKDIIDTATDIIDITHETEDLYYIIKAVEYSSKTSIAKIRRELDKISKKALQRLDSQLLNVVRDLYEAFFILGRIAYITYLASQNKDILHTGLIFYAIGKALEEPQNNKALYYILAAVQLLFKNPEHALALAAYGIKDRLPVKFLPKKEPWENPEKWASLLYVSFMYDVASKINAELLAEWGLLEILYER